MSADEMNPVKDHYYDHRDSDPADSRTCALCRQYRNRRIRSGFNIDRQEFAGTWSSDISRPSGIYGH